MDLVFKRYSNPFFLDLAIENSDLGKFVDVLLKKQDEEKAWEMYLATIMLNDKSFNDWKAETFKSSVKKTNTRMTKKEIDTTLKEANSILQRFKPPKEGGFYKC